MSCEFQSSEASNRSQPEVLLERAKSGRGVAKPAKTAVTRSPLWITSLLCCVLLFAGYNARAAEEV